MTATVELEWPDSAGATIEVPVKSSEEWDLALCWAMVHAVTKLGAKNFTRAKVTQIK